GVGVEPAVGIAIEKWGQAREGIRRDLLAGGEGGGGAGGGGAGGGGPGAAAPLRGVVAGQGGGSAAALQSGATQQDFIGACPDCGSQLAFIEGCAKCHVCGFSECG